MRYQQDQSIPTTLKYRQEIADANHSPRKDEHPVAQCMSAGDLWRTPAIPSTLESSDGTDQS